MATFVKKATLKLCPFCTGRAVQSAKQFKTGRYSMYFISCTNSICRATGPKCKTAKAAIANWNYRDTDRY